MMNKIFDQVLYLCIALAYMGAAGGGAGELFKLAQAGLLEGGVVVVVENVEADDESALIEQTLSEVVADEAGDAGERINRLGKPFHAKEGGQDRIDHPGHLDMPAMRLKRMRCTDNAQEIGRSAPTVVRKRRIEPRVIQRHRRERELGEKL